MAHIPIGELTVNFAIPFSGAVTFQNITKTNIVTTLFPLRLQKRKGSYWDFNFQKTLCYVIFLIKLENFVPYFFLYVFSNYKIKAFVTRGEIRHFATFRRNSADVIKQQANLGS